MADNDKLEYGNGKLGPRFEEALLFATRQHAGQTRKKTDIPYIAHLLSVTSLVLEAGGDEDQAIAALLHDVVEDCGGAPMLAEVHQRFGPRVAHIVEGCTDTDQTPKPPWRTRKADYLRHLRHADEDVRLVAAADKLHNARAILGDFRHMGDSVWERFAGQRDGTLWYYRALVEIFRERPANSITRELERTVTELEQLAGR
jgi:(p)ppGpp synthase/HD superfamily hydrolase